VMSDCFLFHGCFICTPVASGVSLFPAWLISTVITVSIFSRDFITPLWVYFYCF